jgi:hypothetical protein
MTDREKLAAGFLESRVSVAANSSLSLISREISGRQPGALTSQRQLLRRDAGGGNSIHNCLEGAGIHPFSIQPQAVFVTHKRVNLDFVRVL